MLVSYNKIIHGDLITSIVTKEGNIISRQSTYDGIYDQN